jgi:hypothetical protein
MKRKASVSRIWFFDFESFLQIWDILISLEICFMIAKRNKARYQLRVRLSYGCR